MTVIDRILDLVNEDLDNQAKTSMNPKTANRIYVGREELREIKREAIVSSPVYIQGRVDAPPEITVFGINICPVSLESYLSLNRPETDPKLSDHSI